MSPVSGFEMAALSGKKHEACFMHNAALSGNPKISCPRSRRRRKGGSKEVSSKFVKENPLQYRFPSSDFNERWLTLP